MINILRNENEKFNRFGLHKNENAICDKIESKKKKSIYDRIEGKKIVKQILFMSKTKICDKIRTIKEIEFMATLGLSRN